MAGDLIVTVQDLYSVPAWNGSTGYCAEGARVWCAQHGLDWLACVRNGVPAAVLEATGDAFALQLVAHARAQRAAEAAAAPQEATGDGA